LESMSFGDQKASYPEQVPATTREQNRDGHGNNIGSTSKSHLILLPNRIRFHSLEEKHYWRFL